MQTWGIVIPSVKPVHLKFSVRALLHFDLLTWGPSSQASPAPELAIPTSPPAWNQPGPSLLPQVDLL